MVNLSIYSTRSHQVRSITILGILIKLRLIIVEEIFLKLFFPYRVIESNKLDVWDLDACQCKSYATFTNTLLKLGRSIQCAIYSINNSVGLKPLTCLRKSVWVILMNTDLTTTFKTALILCAVLKLNQLLIFYCTAIVIQTSA